MHEKILKDRDLALDGDLSCRADLEAEPKVTASCEGTAEPGGAISGTFDGTADVENAECSATMKVEIGGKEVVNEPDVDCFASP